MKKITFFFFTFLYLSVLQFINSQQYYSEQNSGVTSSLNSVSMMNSFMPLQVWICGDSGVVLKTTNLGANWVKESTGIPLNENLVNISCRAADTVLTTGNIGTTTFVYRTVNGGTSWSQVFTQVNGHINSIWMRDGTNGFMEGNPVGGRWSLWKTSNGGLNWDSTGLFLAQAGSETGWNNSLAIINNNIWFGTNNTRIYKSINNGINWSNILTPEVNSFSVWLYYDTTSYIYALAGGININRTTNSGTNWVQNPCPDTQKVLGFCEAYVGVQDIMPSDTYCIRNYSKIYVGTFSNFLPEYVAPSGNYNHIGYSLIFSQYTWAVRTNGGITKIALFRGGAVRTISSEIPKNFNVNQNYPNPFNPETKIRFNIPSGGSSNTHSVLIKVYDITGREVATLVDEQLHPGEYEVSFNAERYSSGIYYYRVQSDDFTDVKKMVLIK